jgi:hypothetical protein
VLGRSVRCTKHTLMIPLSNNPSSPVAAGADQSPKNCLLLRRKAATAISFFRGSPPFGRSPTSTKGTSKFSCGGLRGCRAMLANLKAGGGPFSLIVPGMITTRAMMTRREDELWVCTYVRRTTAGMTVPSQSHIKRGRSE